MNPIQEVENLQQTVFISGLSINFQEVTIPQFPPNGLAVALAAGFRAEDGASVLAVLESGELEDLRPDETAGDSVRKFIAVVSDRSYKFTIDGTKCEWPARLVTGGQLRKLGHVSEDLEIYQVMPGGAERTVRAHDLVDLDSPGVEHFKTRAREWKLNVQGVLLTSHEPIILARDAIKDAGFDPQKNWIIVLRVKGEPKREITLDTPIDLRTPGIEKLRLTPKEVGNGEPPQNLRREFKLLEFDEEFLDNLGLPWETVVVIDPTQQNQQRRWLLLHGFPVPAGYTVESTLLALDIPLTYPGAQIDMFYTAPPLALKSGQAIPSTQVTASIGPLPLNGWSRHRGAQNPWDSNSDNVATHLALVESCLLKELGQ